MILEDVRVILDQLTDFPEMLERELSAEKYAEFTALVDTFDDRLNPARTTRRVLLKPLPGSSKRSRMILLSCVSSARHVIRMRSQPVKRAARGQSTSSVKAAMR